MINQDALINKIVKSKIADMRVSIPAQVVGIQDLKDGFIDVQPIVNYSNQFTRETAVEGVIRRVRVCYPSTKTTTICFPINQGDTVDLVFQSVNIATFISGNKEPHNPSFSSFNNRSDVVAYVGFEPYQQSCMNPNNYKNDFDNQDLNIVHNKNTDNEVVLKLTADGELKIKCPQKVTVEASDVHVEASNVTLDCSLLNAKNALVQTTGDVQIKGKSVYQFMNSHVHAGVQAGSSSTLPPTPL